MDSFHNAVVPRPFRGHYVSHNLGERPFENPSKKGVPSPKICNAFAASHDMHRSSLKMTVNSCGLLRDKHIYMFCTRRQ